MRMNALLNNESFTYVDKCPVVIPVQGEHPHGQFHAMHCYLRLFRPFLERCALIIGCENQISMEPAVSKFNVHRFFFLQAQARTLARRRPPQQS